MSLGRLMGGFVAVVLCFAFVASFAPVVHASRADLEARRAQRAVERAQRDAEREARRAERVAEREARHSDSDSSDVSGGCSCSARLSFSEPDLSFNGSGVLVFTPRLDVTLRSHDAAACDVGVVYSGTATFSSDDVVAPPAISFDGSETIGSVFGDSRYRFSGLKLASVPFPGLLSGLVGFRERVDGVVEMEARLIGCGDATEHRALSFSLHELGDLRVRGWRSVR